MGNDVPGLGTPELQLNIIVKGNQAPETSRPGPMSLQAATVGEIAGEGP